MYPPVVRRINITGSSGSGKSTLARAMAQRLDAPHVQIDALFHQPNWEPLPTDQLREQVAQAISGDRWVVDGNYYSKIHDVVWPRADTVLFFDLPRWRVMSQLLRRTLRRTITQEELWNGNREQPSNFLSLDREQNLLLWSWTRHRALQERFDRARSDPRWAHIAFHRLRSHAEAQAVLQRLRP